MSRAWKFAAFVPVFGLVLLLGGALGQTDKEKPQPETGMFEVRLTDGSTVKLQLLTEQIEITTRYGSLKVPVTDVRRIDVGFRFPKGIEAKIEKAVERLGSAEFQTREAAAAELVALKELAYPALKKAAKSEDQEVKRRATELVQQLEEKLPAERLRIKDHDVIVTTHFPIAGRIEALTLKGKSAIFGEVQMQMAETRQVRSLTDGAEVVLSVDAARYSLPNNATWMETEVEVERGAMLHVRASGMVNLNPNGNNFQSGPDGTNQFGQNGMFPCGSLVGRIGRTGREFALGSRFDAEASDSGKLHLRIAPSPWGNICNGTFEVRVAMDTWGGFLTGPGDAKTPTTPAPRPGRRWGGKVEVFEKKS